MLDIFKDIRDDLKVVEKGLQESVKSQDSIVSETSTHLIMAGGKRLRPAFSLLSGKFFNYDLNSILPLAVALELIHMASLVHDDVVDSSLTRRGIPTVKAVWGNRISNYLGTYLFAKSLTLIACYQNPLIPGVLSDTSVKMCEGEIQQISTSFAKMQSMVKEYFFRINRKTALLIAASCQLGAVACGAPAQIYMPLRRYGHNIGMAFQITDDILDLVADQEQLGKPVGSDLRQGIITLPVILALKNSQQSSRLRELVFTEDKSHQQVMEAVNLVINSGGVEEAGRVVQKYINKAKQELTKLPPVSARDTLATIAEFISVRKF